jgi:hypothetical protein
MALTTYAELQTAVANYLARTDLTSQIPDFIYLAETRLRRQLRINEMLTQTSLTVSANQITLPTDFLELRDIHFENNPVWTLEYQSPDLFYRNLQTQTSGITVYYTMIANNIKFAPTPNTSDAVSMLYYQKPAYLSSTVTTNVWTENCVDALLYGSLAEAEPYLMNDPRLQTWAQLYERAISDITKSNLGKQYPNTELSVTPR